MDGQVVRDYEDGSGLRSLLESVPEPPQVVYVRLPDPPESEAGPGMRGMLSREGAYTLQVQWVSEAGAAICDSCSTEESGEYFSVYSAYSIPFMICYTCAVWLHGDLEYALR